jgi:hypothetical protein
MNRPVFLRRIDFVPSRLEFEDDTPVDPSRTFGPAPKLCKVCASVWSVVLVTAIAMACAVVHVVARIVA